MKARFLVLGLVFPMLLAAAQAPEVKEFSCQEGGFTILLPGTPTAKEPTKSKTPDDREVTTHMFVVDQKTSAYMVAYMIDENLSKGGEERIARSLENCRKGVETGFKGKLLSEKRILLDKHPGLEFHLEIANIGIYRSRIYIVNDRLFQTTVLGPKEVVTGKEAEKVLDSFKLMK